MILRVLNRWDPFHERIDGLAHRPGPGRGPIRMAMDPAAGLQDQVGAENPEFGLDLTRVEAAARDRERGLQPVAPVGEGPVVPEQFLRVVAHLPGADDQGELSCA